MCRTNTCPWTDSIMRREKVKFVCQKSRATFVPVTICDCVRLHRVLKIRWRSSRVCSTQTSPYMPNLTTTRWWVVTFRLRQIYTEKGTSVTYRIGSWWTPEMVWMFWTKNLLLPRGCDLRLLSRPARYVVTGTTEISGTVSLLMHVKPSQHLRGFVHTDVHCIPSAGESNGPQRRVRTGTLLT